MGSYQVNMPLQTLKNRLDEWVMESGLILNPDFQRGHVWTEQQQTRFMEYLLSGGKSSRVIYFNDPFWNSVKKTLGAYDEFAIGRRTVQFQLITNKITI